MNEIELKDNLMANARGCGICVDGYEAMRSRDREALVQYYTENPDWCMERDFPTLEMLEREFADCEDFGVYIGKNFQGEIFGRKQAYIFHNCKGEIYVEMDYANAVIPMLYFGNGCKIRVKCRQEENKRKPIRVPLYEFGKNDIQARDNAYAKYIRFKREMI